MKRIFIVAFALLFIFSLTPVFAARGGEKGASEEAYEHASDEAIFHRVGDWFSTIGKSKEEKEAIIAERRAKRAEKRAEKELKKRERVTEKETKKAEKKFKKQERITEREVKKAGKETEGKMRDLKRGRKRK